MRAAFVALVLLGVVAVVLDVMVMGALALVGALARVVFRRPFTVAATGEPMERQVVEWG